MAKAGDRDVGTLEIQRPNGEYDVWDVLKRGRFYLIGSFTNTGLLSDYYFVMEPGESEQNAMEEIHHDLEVLATDGESYMSRVKRIPKKGLKKNPPPMYAHHLNEIKAHGLSVKQLRRLYAMVSRGNQKAITFARNVFGIPFDETASQVKAVVKHHVLDLAERKLKKVDWRKNDAYAESWLKRRLRGNPYKGFVGKGEYVWKKLTPSQRLRFIMESPRGRQSTPRSVELFASRAWNFLPRGLKIDLEARFANVESDELVKNPPITQRQQYMLDFLHRVYPKWSEFAKDSATKKDASRLARLKLIKVRSFKRTGTYRGKPFSMMVMQARAMKGKI